MFSDWKQEKAIAALVDDARAMADRLDGARPHIRDSHAAAARFWEASYLAEGQDLHHLASWPAANVKRFIAAAQTRIAALRKARAYDSSDGLTVWLHTARAVSEPRIAPAARDIWAHVMAAGPNTDLMASDLMAEAGLSGDPARRIPQGFGDQDGAA